MPRVFISYVRENIDDVQRLVQVLTSHGVEVWFDQTHLKPGDRWKDVIRREISQGDFFIACFSAEHNNRTRGFVFEELTQAVEQIRQRPHDQSWLIPVLLSPCAVPDISIGGGETLQAFHHVPLYDDWDEGIQRILSVVQGPAGPLLENEEELLQSYLQRLESIFTHFPTELFNPNKSEWTIGNSYVQTMAREEVKNDGNRLRVRDVDDQMPKIIERQVGEALQEYNQVTVVADAGTGKSTLLHAQCLEAIVAYRTQASPIPIFIHLKYWRGKKPLTDFLRNQYSLLPIWGENSLRKKFGEWMNEQYEQGKCILFFDALDEVEPSCRQDVIEALNGLRSPFILTTRPAGYDGRLRAKKVELLSFAEEQIEEYTKRYLGGGDERERFSNALGRHPGTRALAENPLLLSLLCYLFNRGRLQLPATRAELFEEAVAERLTARSAESEKDDRQRVLEESAFHTFFCQGREAEISEGKLLSWSRKVIGGKRAGSLLKDEVVQSGLLTKKTSSSYSFLHPRFQEYFAAAALKRRVEEELEGRRWLFQDQTYYCHLCHKDLVPFSHYFWYVDWQDTITLLAGLLDEATPLIKRLQSEQDDVFGQMLTLAACCLGSAKEVKWDVVNEVIEEISRECEKALREDRPFGSFAIEALIKARQGKWVEQILSFLRVEEMEEPIVISVLYEVFSKEDDKEVRQIVDKTLDKLKNSRAIPVLRELHHRLSPWHPYFRQVVSGALGNRQDVGTVSTLQEMIEKVPVNEDEVIYWSEERTLGNLEDAGAISTLREMLNDMYEDWEVREEAAKALGEIKDPKAIIVLCEALETALIYEDWWSLPAIVDALGNFKGKLGGPKIVSVLCEALKAFLENQYMGLTIWMMMDTVIEALGEVRDPNAFPVLCEALEKGETWQTRGQAAEALAKIGDPRADVLLCNALKDKDEMVRTVVVETMWNLWELKDPRAITILFDFLKDEDEDVREMAGETLSTITKDPKFIPDLEPFLRDQDEEISYVAAEALTNIDDLETVPLLLFAAKRFQEENFWLTLGALGKLKQVRIYENEGSKPLPSLEPSLIG